MREDAKKFVDFVCGEDWEDASDEDRAGGYGVACMQAYINGVKPTIDSLASFLAIENPKEIYGPFSQLLQSGMFSKAFNARGDVHLNLKLDKIKKDEIFIRKTKCAWGHVAAISAGLIVRNYSNMNIKPTK